jgi:hypothetical protein
MEGSTWDAASGTLASRFAYPLPPAQDYAWTADGHIAPGQPLPSSGATPAATAAPANDRAIRLWGAGILQTFSPYPDPTGTGTAKTVLGYYSVRTVWSPDGRYVALLLALGVVLFPAPADDHAKIAPEACSIEGGGFAPCASGTVDYPDAAVRTIARTIGNPSALNRALAPVAWSPDGKLLAAMLPGDGFRLGNPGGAVTVSLLDTTSGAAVKTLSVHTSSTSYASQTLPLMWSPTGRQLALIDTSGSQITLWGAASLAR